MSQVRKLRGTDPMQAVDVEQLAADPIYDELFASIVATPFERELHDALAPMPSLGRRPEQLRAQHYRILATAAAVVLLAAITVPLLAKSTLAPPVKVRPVITAPVWHLTASIVQPAWQVASPGNGSDPFTITCSSASDCYATGLASASHPTTGDVLEVSHDGGASWQPSLLPADSGQVFGLTCPAADTCMALGDDPAEATATNGLGAVLYTTTDAGSHWSSQPIPSGSLGLERLSCGTTSFCVAIASEVGPGGYGIENVSEGTDDGGQTWTESPLPGTFRGNAIQCISATVCVATGMSPTAYDVTNPVTQMENDAAVVYTTDGGTTWQKGMVPTAGMESINSLSCVDTQHCIAVENSNIGEPSADVVITTNDGGATWSATSNQPSAPGTLNLQSVSCSSIDQCWVSGAESEATTAPASGLTTTVPPTTAAPASGTDTSAPPSSLPTSPPISGVVFATTDGGSTWQSEQLPTVQGGLQSVESIACSSNGCLALASQPASAPNTLTPQLVLSNGLPSASASGSSGATSPS